MLRDGQPIYERALTIFRIASQTKAITSVAILSLVEEGKIVLTDPVSRFLPPFARALMEPMRR